MSQISLRYQLVKDAKRFFEILSNPNFLYFPVHLKSVAEEKRWLRGNAKRRRQNTEWNFSILLNDKVIGAIGIKIHQQRSFIGEIGYFLDEAYWGKGYATESVKLAEEIGFKKLKLTRIEIVMQPENKASEKVAIKCGYQKEGLMKKSVNGTDGKPKDAYLYAKVL